jgi:hypothetical protein
MGNWSILAILTDIVPILLVAALLVVYMLWAAILLAVRIYRAMSPQPSADAPPLDPPVDRFE